MERTLSGMRLSQKATIQEYPLKFLQKNIKYRKSYTIFSEKSDFLRLLWFLEFKNFF